jgi:peptidyl-prolyl cis-trans isomerase A (cyclophilin A)
LKAGRLGALVVGMALAVGASVEGQAPATPRPPGGEVGVRLATALGNIDIAVDTAHAPVTAGNFLKYVDAGLYDGGRFYRVTRPDNYTPTLPNRPMMNLVEGDIDPKHAGERLPAIPLERTSVTGLKHVVGTVSMGRNDGDPDSGGSDFFILLDDQPSLDFGGRRFTDAQGAAAFGRVVAGLDVVRTIQQQGPLDEQNRQHLVSPVTITAAKRR